MASFPSINARRFTARLFVSLDKSFVEKGACFVFCRRVLDPLVISALALRGETLNYKPVAKDAYIADCKHKLQR